MAEVGTLRRQLASREKPVYVNMRLVTGEKMRLLFDPKKCQAFDDSFQVVFRNDIMNIRYDAVIVWRFTSDDGVGEEE